MATITQKNTLAALILAAGLGPVAAQGRGIRDANRRCNEQSIWRSSGISRQSRKGSSRGGNFHSHARSSSPKQGGNIQWQPDPGDRTLLGFDGHS
jgi:hypothetical protein